MCQRIRHAAGLTPPAHEGERHFERVALLNFFPQGAQHYRQRSPTRHLPEPDCSSAARTRRPRAVQDDLVALWAPSSSEDRGGEAFAVRGVNGAWAPTAVGNGGGDGVNERGKVLFGSGRGPLVVVSGDKLLNDFDGAPSNIDEAAGEEDCSGQERYLLGLRGRGEGSKISSGVDDERCDARTGQPNGGYGEVTAGGGDSSGGADAWFHRAGRGAAPEGDGTNRRQKAHAFDGVVQKLCGRKVIRGAVRHIRPRDIILGW